MLSEDDVLPVTITVAELPRAVRYVWTPAERVLVLAAWLDDAGRGRALAEWPPQGTQWARRLRIVPDDAGTRSPT